ncbi:MAG: family 20 glycosylhydrolase [Thermomonas sp.]|uniref:beta-N-acetylhexosaminidase n=1 Tax=Thermomonas sp. TaxID=1971895 RepID=UPI0039E3EB1C
MKSRHVPRLSAIALALCLTLPPLAATAADGTPALIPLPASIEAREGSFTLGPDTRLVVWGGDEQAVHAARDFAGLMQSSRGFTPKQGAARRGNQVEFVLDRKASLPGDEAYRLDIDDAGAKIVARAPAGLYYGAVTLWQLATADGGTGAARIDAQRIEDAPRFGWRGFMLDSARHFWSVDEVKRVLDMMAMHKLNTFHWHLTDDQGWRVEIKRYPRLTQVGGCRIPSGDAGKLPLTGAPRLYCGYYTQGQIREVVQYAAQRHITVVPEFDVPGHATAAISAYPELGTTDKLLQPSSEWGVFPNLFNVEESTFQFLENVFDEIVALFPGTYIHVGGDEAVKDQWIASPRVQERMREVGAKNEMEMQSHLIRRLERHLARHGRRLLGWDEILEGGIAPNATVMSWRGTEGGIAAAKSGHDVVMTPASHLYFDYHQTLSPNEPPGRPVQVTLEKVYGFEPVPAELTPEQHKHILGVQANLWTEHTRNFARVQHHAFPRLAAVAEIGWSPAAKRDYAGFLTRLPVQLQRYKALGIEYAKTPFEVLAKAEDERKAGTVKVALDNTLGYPIRYTTDGSEPNAQSPLYAAPVEAKLPLDIRAAAFAGNTALAPATLHRFDAVSLLTRTDEQLATCPDTGRLLLRLEDDGPAEGERAIFNVTIFYPCWLWPQADMDGIGAMKVRLGRIPYYFQLAHDEPNRRFLPAQTPNGELLVQSGGCRGPVLARQPLPADTGADGFIDVDVPVKNVAGRSDLCFTATGDTRPLMWVLDRVTLQPAK